MPFWQWENMKAVLMKNYNDAIYFMGVYLDPGILGEEAIYSEIYEWEDEHEEMSQVFRILLDEDMVNVYWTNDDKFYLEDITGL